ncbi:Glycine reductase complex selenoprotein A [Desulfosporosinus orientis DSM 765]|nr:Glycine reductase complex selenoprotein A [Desulfosporosinus orientis DSM 765]
MDQENQARIRALAEKYGDEELIAVLGSADPEMAVIAAATAAGGDLMLIDPFAEAQCGLKAYHIAELKEWINPEVYLRHMQMMEIILDIPKIIREVSSVRERFFPLEVSL